jgi:carboxyl-terminal processing protease
VNGRPVRDIVKERLPLVNGGNVAVRIRNLNARNYITGGEDSVVVLDVLRKGEKITSRERRYLFQEFNYVSKPDTLAWKLLDAKTGYVNMGLLERNDVQKMFSDLSETEAIIFDIRNYPKSTYPAIAEHLFESKKDFAALTYPDLNYPGAFAWHKTASIGPGAFSKPSWIYEGKVILIVNETTQSHAEYTTMAFQALPKTITVGSQTSAADGNASSLYLPGNYFTYMTGLGVFYPDGTQTQRVGVKIDVPVKVTVRGLVEGRDEYMEKVSEILGKKVH